MLKIMNPATGALIQEVKTDTEESIRAKFQKAASAQKDWAKTSLQTRLDCIRKFRTSLSDQMEPLALKLTEEVGKPIQQSRNEIKGLLGRIDFFLEKTSDVLEDDLVLKDPGQKLEELIRYEPLGVIANISAWNYPYFVGGNVFVPALLTGNAILYKPSEFSTLTGLAIEELLLKSGVPAGCFTTVIGTGEQGAALLKQPINGVFFTGSYSTGAKIAEAASKKMIKMQLELGGKDPVYVCEDVDVASVAAAVSDGAFYNTGQSCCSVERIYVHEKIYDSFVKEFVSTTRSFVMGDPKKDGTYIGAITRSAQIDILEDQVKDALAQGAKLELGGHRVKGAGNYFEPTVLTGVTHQMKVMREESFGPIIGIQKVSSDAEALAAMNDTDYGLTAAIYTTNRERASEILSQVNSGSVYWNCCDRVSPRLPWSGRKHSGIGVTLSTLGIEAFLQPKAWHLRG